MAIVRSRPAQSGAARVAFGRLLHLVKLTVATAVALALPAQAEKAASADAFVDSVGINVHLHYQDTSYANFPRVKQALVGLGLRHVRDGLIDTTWQDFYDRHNELGRSGIKAIYSTSVTQSDQLLIDYPVRMKDNFEGYESPNEYDLSGDANWADTLSKFVARLHTTVKANSGTSKFPVIGPSLTSQAAFAKMRGDCTLDFDNLHNYFGGHNPGTLGWGSNGYGSITWNLANTTATCPGKPVITTETGYQADPALSQGIPEEIAGKYVPRVYLEQWRRNIQRTYLYELVDMPTGFPAGDSKFGLLRADFSAKPAYTALTNLIHLLSDPGPSYVGQDFTFALTGDVSDVDHVLLQKRDGTFYLALWVEEPSYDVNSKKALPVSTHHVLVQSDQGASVVVHSFGQSGAVQTASLAASTTHTVDVTDYVTILEFDGRPQAPVMLTPVVH
jgi:hypothetical protein